MNDRTQTRRGYWLALAGVTVLLCLPVATIEYPPLVDYPNHLARCFILHNYEIPRYFAEYVRVLQPIPNLAMDLIVPPLLGVLSTSLAGRIFLMLEIVLFVIGIHVLGRAIYGRPTWLVLPLAFFVYNSAFLYGFVNYIFGLGLFTLTLGLWLKWREHWTPGRLAMLAIFTLCAFIAHLSAFLFLSMAFGLIAACDGLRRTRPLRDLARDLMPLIPGIAAFCLYMRSSGKVGSIIWNSWIGKLVGPLSIVTAYDNKLIAFIALSTTLLLVVGLGMAILYLVSPLVLFTSSAADTRFIVPAALLLVLSVKADLPRKTARALLIAALILGTIRVAAIWKTWRELDTRIGAEVAMFDRINDGATVFPVFVRAAEGQDKLDRAMEHVICYSVITRRALTPTLFANATQQLIRFRQPHRFATLQHQDSTLWLRLVPDYDYVWTYGLDQSLSERLSKSATAISSGQRATLWRVEKRLASLRVPVRNQ